MRRRWLWLLVALDAATLTLLFGSAISAAGDPAGEVVRSVLAHAPSTLAGVASLPLAVAFILALVAVGSTAWQFRAGLAHAVIGVAVLLLVLIASVSIAKTLAAVGALAIAGLGGWIAARTGPEIPRRAALPRARVRR